MLHNLIYVGWFFLFSIWLEQGSVLSDNRQFDFNAFPVGMEAEDQEIVDDLDWSGGDTLFTTGHTIRYRHNSFLTQTESIAGKVSGLGGSQAIRAPPGT